MIGAGEIRERVRWLACEAPRRSEGDLFPGLSAQERERVMRYVMAHDVGIRDAAEVPLRDVFSVGLRAAIEDCAELVERMDPAREP